MKNQRKEAEIKLAQEQKAYEAEKAKARAEGKEPPKKSTALETAEQNVKDWGTGGSTKRAIDALTHAGLIALSGGSAQSIATAATSPYMNQLIKKATEDYPALNIPTHILWGAVEAELMGGNAQTGAISTAAGELGAKYLTEHLYQKDAKDLTETERNQIKEMAKALTGVAGGLSAAGQGASAVSILSESSIGTTVANNAVENNLLSRTEDEELFNLSEKFSKEGELKGKNKEKAGELLTKDAYIDFLIALNQKEPNKLTDAQKAYLNIELTKISRSLDIPLSDLYRWDFSKSIKRDDRALTKYLSDDMRFWNSYQGKQAQSFATGVLATGVGIGVAGTVRALPTAAKYAQELASFSAQNPVTAELLVTAGYKAGEISYKAYDGQYKTEAEFQNAVYDATKDVIKVPLLSKLKPGAQALNSVAFDFVYEVNKPGATDKQVKTEMIGSSIGSIGGLVGDKVSLNIGVGHTNRIFINTIFSNSLSNYSKGEYEKSYKGDIK